MFTLVVTLAAGAAADAREKHLSRSGPDHPGGPLEPDNGPHVRHTGPDNCFAQSERRQIGTPVSWWMSVSRAGATVTLDYDVRNSPTDDLQETGTVDANSFAAKSDVWPMFFPPCSDGTELRGTFIGSVIGRFSDDGKHIGAEEVWSYRFSSGTIDMHLTWSADQQ